MWTAPLYGAWSPRAGAVRPTRCGPERLELAAPPLARENSAIGFRPARPPTQVLRWSGGEPCHGIGRRNNVADAVDCLAGLERRPINHCGVPRSPPHTMPVCITGYCNPSVSNRFAYVSFPLWRRLRRRSAVLRAGRDGVLATRLTRFWRGAPAHAR